MIISIRTERQSDYAATENLTREAFYNVYAPGCDEHYLLHVLHRSKALIPQLSLVAEYDGEVIGHVLGTRAKIVDNGLEWTDVLCLGPISVLPKHQRKGVAREMIRELGRRAGEGGYRAILLYGNPEVYLKMGFLPAERFAITTSDAMYADALHAMPLYPGALNGIKGRYCEDPVFGIDAEAAKAFDEHFPPKGKMAGTPSQLRFQEILTLRRPAI